MLKELLAGEPTEKLMNLILWFVGRSQEINFSMIGKMLIITYFKWSTECSGSTVTDHAERHIVVVDLKKTKTVGMNCERNLFRTTWDGVVGHKYSIEIKDKKIEKGKVMLSFWDYTSVEVKIK